MCSFMTLTASDKPGSKFIFRSATIFPVQSNRQTKHSLLPDSLQDGSGHNCDIFPFDNEDDETVLYIAQQYSLT